MLYFPKTRPFPSREWSISASAGALVDGMALISKVEAGEGKVLASGGNSGEVFAGICLNGLYALPTSQIVSETVTVPAVADGAGDYKVQLSQTPDVVTNVSAVDTSALTALTYNNSLGSTQFKTLNGYIYFNAGQAGLSYYVTYRRNLTADQAALVGGESQVYSGISPSAKIGRIGSILKGDVYTDNFDPTANWFAADISDVKCGANGIITRGGSGGAIPCQVLAAPGPDQPFLGLQLN